MQECHKREQNQSPKVCAILDLRRYIGKGKPLTFWITGSMFSKLASSQRSSEFTRKLMQSQVTLQSFPTRKFWKPFLTANWFWILEMKIRGSKMLWIKPAELLYARRSKLSLLSSTARKAHCILDCCTDDSFGSCNPKSTMSLEIYIVSTITV